MQSRSSILQNGQASQQLPPIISVSQSLSISIDDGMNPQYKSLGNQLSNLNDQQMLVRKPEEQRKDMQSPTTPCEQTDSLGPRVQPHQLLTQQFIKTPQIRANDRHHHHQLIEEHNARLLIKANNNQRMSQKSSDPKFSDISYLMEYKKGKPKHEAKNQPPLFSKFKSIQNQNTSMISLNEVFIQDKASNLYPESNPIQHIQQSFFQDKNNLLAFYNSVVVVAIFFIFSYQLYLLVNRHLYETKSRSHVFQIFIITLFFVDATVVKINNIYQGSRLVIFLLYSCFIILVNLVNNIRIGNYQTEWISLVVFCRVFLFQQLVVRSFLIVQCNAAKSFLQFMVYFISICVLYHLLTCLILLGYDVPSQTTYFHILLKYFFLFHPDMFPIDILAISQLILFIAFTCQIFKCALFVLIWIDIPDTDIPINDFLIKWPLSQNLKIDIFSYLRQKLQRKNDQAQENTLKIIPPHMRHLLRIETFYEMLNSIPMVKECFSRQTVTMLCTRINDQILHINDTIKLDTQQLLLVQSGSLKVHTNENNQLPFKGSIFGTKTFFEGQNRTSRLLCVDTCRLGSLRYCDFVEVIQQKPDEYERFCMLRDQLIFEERKDLAGEKCLICGQMNHENKSCKTLFFIPNRLHILPFSGGVQQERNQFMRVNDYPPMYQEEKKYRCYKRQFLKLQEAAFIYLHQNFQKSQVSYSYDPSSYIQSPSNLMVLNDQTLQDEISPGAVGFHHFGAKKPLMAQSIDLDDLDQPSGNRLVIGATQDEMEDQFSQESSLQYVQQPSGFSQSVYQAFNREGSARRNSNNGNVNNSSQSVPFRRQNSSEIKDSPATRPLHDNKSSHNTSEKDDPYSRKYVDSIYVNQKRIQRQSIQPSQPTSSLSLNYQLANESQMLAEMNSQASRPTQKKLTVLSKKSSTYNKNNLNVVNEQPNESHSFQSKNSNNQRSNWIKAITKIKESQKLKNKKRGSSKSLQNSMMHGGVAYQQKRNPIDLEKHEFYCQFERGRKFTTYFPQFNFDQCVENYNKFYAQAAPLRSNE